MEEHETRLPQKLLLVMEVPELEEREIPYRLFSFAFMPVNVFSEPHQFQIQSFPPSVIVHP